MIIQTKIGIAEFIEMIFLIIALFLALYKGMCWGVKIVNSKICDAFYTETSDYKKCIDRNHIKNIEIIKEKYVQEKNNN